MVLFFGAVYSENGIMMSNYSDRKIRWSTPGALNAKIWNFQVQNNFQIFGCQDILELKVET